MEAKVNKVIARVNEEESLLFQSLKCRVQEATEKLVQLQGSGSVITNMISKLNEAAIDNAPPENYENDNERIDFESKKLFRYVTTLLYSYYDDDDDDEYTNLYPLLPALSGSYTPHFPSPAPLCTINPIRLSLSLSYCTVCWSSRHNFVLLAMRSLY